MNQITLDTFTWHAAGENVLRSFEGFEYPSTRTVIEDLPTTDGALYITSKFGRRRLSWMGDLIDNKLAQRIQMITPMTQELKTLKFTTYDNLQLQTDVQVVQVLMPYTMGTNTFQVEAIAPDYRFYSQALQSVVTGTTRLVGGTAIPTEIPLSLAVTGGASKPIATNSGHTDAPVTFIIRGPGTDFTIQNQTTGEILRLNLTLLTNETVTITSTTALKGANQNVFGSVTGSRWEMAPGSNVIHFDALSGTDDNTQLTLEFRSAFLGV